jgi:hypothetical protein
MAYLMEKAILSDEPVGNWESVEYYMPAISSSDDTDGSMRSTDSLMENLKRASLANSLRASIFSMNNNVLKSLVKVSDRPSEMNSLHDVHVNDFKNEISCFL